MFLLRYARKILVLPLALMLLACDYNSRDTNEPIVDITPPTPTAAPAPQPPARPPLNGEVSQSETNTQTAVSVAPAMQKSSSENFGNTGFIEATNETDSASANYTTKNSVQLIYRAG